jgi:hypothetical protein
VGGTGVLPGGDENWGKKLVATPELKRLCRILGWYNEVLIFKRILKNLCVRACVRNWIQLAQCVVHWEAFSCSLFQGAFSIIDTARRVPG